MLAESVSIKENEKLVAEAIEGLVNSDSIPADQRLGVLTECLKILSVLEAENSGDQIQTISTRITEEVKRSAPEVLRRIQANESVDPGFNPPQPSKEDTMTYPNPGTPPAQQQPQMNQDTLTWHQQQVNYHVGQAVAAKEQEISGLKDTVIKSQREHTETKKRLKAAESLIEDFTAKIKDLEEGGPADEVLKERYAAAVALLDEALKRLPEIKSLSTRNETLEGLLQSSFDHVIENRLDKSVKEHLDQIDPSYHDTVRPVLENCQTPEQVAEAFKAFAAVSKGAPAAPQSREPLPNGGGSSRVDESTNPQRPAPAPTNLVSMLGSRLSRAV